MRWHSWNWNWPDWRSNWRRRQWSRRALHRALRFHNEIQVSGVVCLCYCLVFYHRSFPEPVGPPQKRLVSVNLRLTIYKDSSCKKWRHSHLLCRNSNLLWNLSFVTELIIFKIRLNYNNDRSFYRTPLYTIEKTRSYYCCVFHIVSRVRLIFFIKFGN